MPFCGTCRRELDEIKNSDLILKCLICKIKFHQLCSKILPDICIKMNECKNISFTCDRCIVKRDEKIDTLDVLNQINVKLLEFESKFNEQNKFNNEIRSHFKHVVDSVNTISYEKKSKWSDLVSNSPSTSNDNNNKNNSVRSVNSRNTSSMNKSSENKRGAKKDVTSSNSESILIIKPNDANNKSAKSVVTAILKPEIDPVKNLRETAKGDVVIKCNDENAMRSIKEKLDKNANGEIKVSEPKKMTPRVKVVGFETEYLDHDKLINTLKIQNADIFDESAVIEVIRVNKQPKSCTAVLSIDHQSFCKCINKKVSIGWYKCAIFEQIDVIRCFKCNQFGHVANECKSATIVCPLCADEHDIKQCKSNFRKCINCFRNNEMFNTNKPTDHSAMSIRCPLMVSRVQKRKNEIRYNA